MNEMWIASRISTLPVEIVDSQELKEEALILSVFKFRKIACNFMQKSPKPSVDLSFTSS